jgi:hypothetical protein
MPAEARDSPEEHPWMENKYTSHLRASQEPDLGQSSQEPQGMHIKCNRYEHLLHQ